jgi:hypothetical protein
MSLMEGTELAARSTSVPLRSSSLAKGSMPVHVAMTALYQKVMLLFARGTFFHERRRICRQKGVHHENIAKQVCLHADKKHGQTSCGPDVCYPLLKSSNMRKPIQTMGTCLLFLLPPRHQTMVYLLLTKSSARRQLSPQDLRYGSQPKRNLAPNCSGAAWTLALLAQVTSATSLPYDIDISARQQGCRGAPGQTQHCPQEWAPPSNTPPCLLCISFNPSPSHQWPQH